MKEIKNNQMMIKNISNSGKLKKTENHLHFQGRKQQEKKPNVTITQITQSNKIQNIIRKGKLL